VKQRYLYNLPNTTRFVGSTVKAKAVPLHAMEALGGERRYSSYSFTTSALDGGEWSASCPGRALPPGKEPPVPIVQEAGWASEPVWTQRLEGKNPLPLPGIEPRSPSGPARSQTLYCLSYPAPRKYSTIPIIRAMWTEATSGNTEGPFGVHKLLL
jgi:hypothetical protein